jgi:hypothetical protein
MFKPYFLQDFIDTFFIFEQLLYYPKYLSLDLSFIKGKTGISVHYPKIKYFNF